MGQTHSPSYLPEVIQKDMPDTSAVTDSGGTRDGRTDIFTLDRKGYPASMYNRTYTICTRRKAKEIVNVIERSVYVCRSCMQEGREGR